MSDGMTEARRLLVNKPDHYRHLPVECIEISQHFNFNLGNALKYIWRCGHKDDPIQDLEKAAWYVRQEIHRIKGNARAWNAED